MDSESRESPGSARRARGAAGPRANLAAQACKPHYPFYTQIAYREFHRRQVHELEALGERRVDEARARRSATARHLALRGAAARLGRSDGTIVRPESGSVERPESDESSNSESDAELFEDGPVAKRRRLLQSGTPQSGMGATRQTPHGSWAELTRRWRATPRREYPG